MSSPPGTELSSLPPFYAAELQNALSEQLFGICAYSVIEAGPHSAMASVSLLEGQKIFVLLTESGYSVSSFHPSCAALQLCLDGV